MTWIEILRIVREHKDETVNIVSNKSCGQFLAIMKKKTKFHIFGFCKHSVYRHIDRKRDRENSSLSLSLPLSSLSLTTIISK